MKKVPMGEGEEVTIEPTMTSFYAEIIDALPIALLVLDKDQRIMLANGSLSELLSFAERVEGKLIGELIPHDGLKKFVGEAQREGYPKEMELHLLLPKGNLKALKVVIVGLKSDEKGGAYSLLLIEDVSEKIRLEQQLVQSEKLAGMGQLAASIAHELGNPLGIMSTTLQYMQQSLHEKNDDLAAEMEVILDNLNRMHELLKDLSEFTGPAKHRIEYCDLHQSLSHVLAFVSKEAEEHKVIIDTDFDNQTLRCPANHRELKQVFLNLFKNAIEAMGDGGKLTVKTRLDGGTLFGRDAAIMIDISDTGVGIPESELDLIFRPFYSTKKGGMGMGLSFCRRVIEEHGGDIMVKSMKARGTTFTITLPVRKDQRDDNEGA